MSDPLAVIPKSNHVGWWWLIAFLVGLALYAGTANAGPQWQDSGWQQYRMASGTIQHPFGLALTHPLQYHLGRAAMSVLPIEPAWAATLVSSFFGAIGVANIVLLLRLTCSSKLAALVAGCSLLMSHTYWQYATLTESYTLVVALLSAEWLCLAMFIRTRHSIWLLALAVASGLGVSNHLIATLAIPVNAFVVLSICWSEKQRLWLVLITPVMGLIAMTPYLLVVIQDGLGSGDWAQTIRSALFGNFQDQVLNTSLTLQKIVFASAYVFYNFADLTLLGVFLWWRSAVGSFALLQRAVAAQALIFLLFAFRYDVVDQYTFFIPSYATLALLSGWGWNRIVVSNAKKHWPILVLVSALILTLSKPGIYYTVSEVLSSQGALSSLVKNRPYRDGYAGFFLPWSSVDQSAEKIVTQATKLSSEKGVVLTEIGMIRHALFYAQATGQLSENVTICQVVIGINKCPAVESDALAAGQSVILIPEDRDQPAYHSPQGVWVREGDLYRLDPRLARLGQ